MHKGRNAKYLRSVDQTVSVEITSYYTAMVKAVMMVCEEVHLSLSKILHTKYE